MNKDVKSVYNRALALFNNDKSFFIENDIKILLEEVTEKRFNDLWLFSYILTEEQIKLFDSYIQKRLDNIPVSYIINKQNFFGYDFYVDENVLIPRKETEILVELVLKICEGKKVLDMCTGSGIIPITLNLEGNPFFVLGTDISEKAIDVCNKNKKNLLNSIKQSNVDFTVLDKLNGIVDKFDIFISNPPYITHEALKDLEPEVKECEPLLALDGGEDGLYFYKYIKDNLYKVLNIGGFMFLEIGYDQGKVCKDMFSHLFEKVNVIKDYSRRDRIIIGEVFKGHEDNTCR